MIKTSCQETRISLLQLGLHSKSYHLEVTLLTAWIAIWLNLQIYLYKDLLSIETSVKNSLLESKTKTAWVLPIQLHTCRTQYPEVQTSSKCLYYNCGGI